MGTLKSGDNHKWNKKDKYTKLSFKWVQNNIGDGEVSVKIGDAAATSYNVPHADINCDANEGGKITNNTDKTIDYTLSK